MRPRTSVFIATSLDGFIAREDDSIDWLDEANQGVPAGEDFGYGAFIASVDALVMGRNSFEKVLSFEPWPYPDTPVVVLSRRGVAVPAALAGKVSTSAENPEALCRRLASEGARHLYIDGGLTIQGFLAAGLIDELIITLIPVLLGRGKPLFGPLPADVSLEHLGTRAYDCGFVQHHYRCGPTMAG